MPRPPSVALRPHAEEVPIAVALNDILEYDIDDLDHVVLLLLTSTPVMASSNFAKLLDRFVDCLSNWNWVEGGQWRGPPAAVWDWRGWHAEKDCQFE